MSTPFRRIAAAAVMTGAAVCVAPAVAGATPAAPAACPLIALGNGVLKVDTNCLTNGLGVTTPTTAAVPTPTLPVVQTPTTLDLGDDDGNWTIHVEDDGGTPTTLPSAARKAAEDSTPAGGDTGPTGTTGTTGAAGATGAASTGATGGNGASAVPAAARSGAARSSSSDLAGSTPAPVDAAPVAAATPEVAAAALDVIPASKADGGSSWITWSLVAVALVLAAGLVVRKHIAGTRSEVDGPARWYDRVTFS